jgi:hypothetical protein
MKTEEYKFLSGSVKIQYGTGTYGTVSCTVHLPNSIKYGCNKKKNQYYKNSFEGINNLKLGITVVTKLTVPPVHR